MTENASHSVSVDVLISRRLVELAAELGAVLNQAENELEQTLLYARFDTLVKAEFRYGQQNQAHLPGTLRALRTVLGALDGRKLDQVHRQREDELAARRLR